MTPEETPEETPTQGPSPTETPTPPLVSCSGGRDLLTIFEEDFEAWPVARWTIENAAGECGWMSGVLVQ